MIIQDSERDSWSYHPVTLEFIALLKSSKQETMAAWANEAFVGSDGHTTLQANAKALGGMFVIDQVIEIIESYTIKNEEILQ